MNVLREKYPTPPVIYNGSIDKFYFDYLQRMMHQYVTTGYIHTIHKFRTSGMDTEREKYVSHIHGTDSNRY